MSFLLSVALGAAQEYNVMSAEERAARAEEAKRRREAKSAEEARIQAIADEMAKEEHKANLELEMKQKEHTAKMQNASANLASYYAAQPDRLHFPDANTGEIITLDYPKEYFDLDTGIQRVQSINDKMEQFGQVYFLEPVEGKQDRFKLGTRKADADGGLYDSSDLAEAEANRINAGRGANSKFESYSEQHTTGQWIVKTRAKGKEDATPEKYETAGEAVAAVKADLTASGENPDKYNITSSGSPGNYTASASPKTPTKEDTKGYETAGEAIEAAKGDLTARGEDVANYTFSTTGVPGDFRATATQKAKTDDDVVDPRSKMPLTAGYFYGVHAGTEEAIKDPKAYGYQRIVDLTPNKTLEIAGEAALDGVYRENYTILQQAVSGTDTQKANANMTLLLDHFTPEVVQRAVDVYETNPEGLDLFVKELKSRGDTWLIDTSDQGTGSKRLVRPLITKYPELADYAELHPEIEKAFKSIGLTPEVVRSINLQVGNPENLPMGTAIDDPENPGFSIIPSLDVPRVVEAFAQPTGNVQNNVEVTRIPSSVTNTIETMASASPGISDSLIYTLLDNSYELDANNRPVMSAETTAKAFDGLKQNHAILNRSGVSFIGLTDNGTSIEFSSPAIHSTENAKILSNLSTFGEYGDQILALEATLPATDVSTAKSITDVGGAKDAKTRYEEITGNNNFDGFDRRRRQAAEVIRIHEEFMQIDESGNLVVGAPLTIDRLKAGASYLISYLSGIDTVSYAPDDVNRENPLTASTTGRSVLSNLEAELSAALAPTQEDQMSALINLNMKMQSYAFASMMDPNGRLSDQDRQQSDEAIAAMGFTANDRSFMAVSSKLFDRAKHTMAIIDGYSSNRPGNIIATHAYVRMGGGLKTDIRKFLGVGNRRVSSDPAPDQAAQDVSNSASMASMYGDVSGAGDTPAPQPTPEPTPVPQPEPAPEEVSRPGNVL